MRYGPLDKTLDLHTVIGLMFSEMIRALIIMSLFTIACAVTPLYREIPEINGFEVKHPQVGTLRIRSIPINVTDDTLRLNPNEKIVFGQDPDVETIPWDNRYPNPFCATTSITFINLCPDTLDIKISCEDEVPETCMYHGYIDRGKFYMTLSLWDDMPSGIYTILLSLGNKTERIERRHIRKNSG